MLRYQRLNADARSAKPPSFRYLLAMLALLGHTTGSATTITVGDHSCTTKTIESAIALAAGRAGPDTIVLTRDTRNGEHYYLPNNALVINNQDLEIVGGYDDCFDTVPDGYTDISGSGGNPDPIFRITGGGVVRLTGLRVTLGDADNAEGGGIDYRGHGSLILTQDLIDYNHDEADFAFGGGVRFEATGGDAYLYLGNVDVIGNSAQSGGGVYATGTTNIATVDFGDGVRIVSNTALGTGSTLASGNGGGVALDSVIFSMRGSANLVAGNAAVRGGGLFVSRSNPVNISASAAPGSAGLFQDNTAIEGGALFADRAALFLHSRTDHQPITLAKNRANAGGAIASTGSTICLKDARLTGNQATLGAALSYGGAVYWNRNCTIPDAVAIVCTAQDRCNRVDSNLATGDSDVVRGDNGRAEIERVYFTQNDVNWLMRTSSQSALEIYDSVVALNYTDGGLFQYFGPAMFSGLTIASNFETADGTSFYVFWNGFTQATTVRDTLVDQRLFYQLANDLTKIAPDRLMSDTADMSSAPWSIGSYVNARPIFDDFDPLTLNLVQTASSPGVDAAPARGGVDIEGKPRDFDINGVDHGFGPRDIGAFERTDTTNYDLIFRNGFDSPRL